MKYLQQIYRVVLLLWSTCLLSIEVESTEQGPSYFFYQQPEYPRDCKEARDQCLSDSSSGVYVIKPDGYLEPFEVFCNNDISPGGWTVIQRRNDGSLTFRRNLEDYESGFGFLSSEFWIGHDKLSYLTNQAEYQLRIDMMLSNGSSFYVKYNSFRISDELSDYAIVSAAEFTSNWSCIVSTCPLKMIQESCTCQNLCTDPIGQADCHTECIENCASEGCLVSGTNSFISNGGSYINADCTQNCTCIDNQLICNSDFECSTEATCKVKDNIRKCYCNEGYGGDGETCIRNNFTDCYEVYQAGYTTDGLYRILPIGWSGSPFTVFCDMTTAGGGWTVIQRRTDGVSDFYRDWNQYKVGFGSPTAGNDLWLGNEKIYLLTNQNGYKLRVDVITASNSQYYAEYVSFQINHETDKYRLSISGYAGNADNMMIYNDEKQFSTHDQDNDRCNDQNFAEGHRGAWWYYEFNCNSECLDDSLCVRFEYGSSGCYAIGTNVNLNGDYKGGNGNNIYWYRGRLDGYCNLKFTEMKIRPSSV